MNRTNVVNSKIRTSLKMTRDDDHDSHGANAPLIVPGAVDAFTQRQEVNEDQAEDSPSNDPGSTFLWALALSACISGLLFGYEYVHYRLCYNSNSYLRLVPLSDDLLILFSGRIWANTPLSAVLE